MTTHVKPNLIFFVLTFLLLTPCCLNAQNNEKWYVFQLNELNFEKSNVFLDTPTIASTVEIITNDHSLKASEYDRVLFVVEGNSFAIVEKQKVNLKTGDILFIKANDEIHFLEELKLLSWISKSTKTEHDFKTQVFSEDTVTSERNSSENVWNRFIENTTMTTGLYMLPKAINGDDTLNHKFDEINLVLSGTAKFKMDDTIIDVRPGSIMWVKSGVGHYFYDLSDDFDVYILFENH